MDDQEKRKLIEALFNVVKWVAICAALFISIRVIREAVGIKEAIGAAALFIILLVVTSIYGFKFVIEPISNWIDEKFTKKHRRIPKIMVGSDGKPRIITYSSTLIFIILCLLLYFAINSTVTTLYKISISMANKTTQMDRKATTQHIATDH